MIEINEENKLRFFNLYRGQKVFRLDGLSNLKTRPHETLLDGDILELYDPSKISDKHAIEVAILMGYTSFDYDIIAQIQIGKKHTAVFPYTGTGEYSCMGEKGLLLADFLRYNSYCLP